jgi:hypothetical protein
VLRPELPSDDIQEMIDHLQDRKVYLVKDLIEHLGEKGIPFLVLLLSLPFLQPIPLPGLSVVLGLMIALKGVGMIYKNKIWLPNWILNKSLTQLFRADVLMKIKNILIRIEAISYTPFNRIFQFEKTISWMSGICIIVEGLVLALPLPPGTNFPPAAVIALLSLGYVQKNGLIWMAGAALFLAQVITVSWIGHLVAQGLFKF